MKPVSGKRMGKILEGHGWTLIRIKGSHYIYSHPDSRVRIPVPVHGNEDLRIGTQRDIMRQAGLTDDDL
jgi:predicted RNA binding protein YcfA (HicA-like mRNA interferase family)